MVCGKAGRDFLDRLLQGAWEPAVAGPDKAGFVETLPILRDKSHRPKALPKLLSPKWSGG